MSYLTIAKELVVLQAEVTRNRDNAKHYVGGKLRSNSVLWMQFEMLRLELAMLHRKVDLLAKREARTQGCAAPRFPMDVTYHEINHNQMVVFGD